MMLETKFSILGMTCQSCVAKVTERLEKLPGVTSVKVDLDGGTASIYSPSSIETTAAQKALQDLNKYSVEPYAGKTNVLKSPVDQKQKSAFQTYKPLIVIFCFIFAVSLAYQFSQDSFNRHVFMNHIMAGFFIGLSFFKFLDLKAFSESFSSYDPIAQRVLTYGLIYPFIELLLGLLFVAGFALQFANAMTILVLAATTFGVVKRLQSKSQFQCACLGTSFSLPLSYVTVTENVAMIAMAFVNLINL